MIYLIIWHGRSNQPFSFGRWRRRDSWRGCSLQGLSWWALWTRKFSQARVQLQRCPQPHARRMCSEVVQHQGQQEMWCLWARDSQLTGDFVADAEFGSKKYQTTTHQTNLKFTVYWVIRLLLHKSGACCCDKDVEGPFKNYYVSLVENTWCYAWSLLRS